jgi:hypothetical protein
MENDKWKMGFLRISPSLKPVTNPLDGVSYESGGKYGPPYNSSKNQE